MIFEAMFYNYRMTPRPSAIIATELDRLRERGEKDESAVREIELALTRGHEHFQARRYRPALRDYLKARDLIAALVRPRRPGRPGAWVDNPLSVDQAELLIAEMAERLRRFAPWRPPSPDPVELAEPPSTWRPWDDLGVSAPGPAEGTPAMRIGTAVGVARTGRLGTSRELLGQVIDELGDDVSADRAAALENLGVVEAMDGKPDAAMRYFERAEADYQALQDPGALGGALENHAGALVASGNVNDAIDRLGQAAAAFDRAVAQGGQAGLIGTTRGRRTGGGESPTRATFASAHLESSVRVQAQAAQLRHIQGRNTFFGRLVGRLRRGITPRAEATSPLQLRTTAAPGSGEVRIEPATTGAANGRRLRIVLGDEPGLRETAGETPAAAPTGREAAVPLMARTLDFDLESATLGSSIRDEYYLARRDLRTLAELGNAESVQASPQRFDIDLVHHYYFTIHVALGKTYTALGRYEYALKALRTARDYPYINQALEVPFVWVQMARTYLEWGHHYYRRGDREEARDTYLNIVFVQLSEVRLDETSELYGPIFAAPKADAESLLPLLDEGEVPAINPLVEDLVRQAYQRLRMIEAGLNWFGVHESPVTIFRFRYLQSVARYFAEQAIKAERDFINFWTNAERETQSVMQLEQAVEIAEEMVELEKRRIAEAEAMRDAAEAAVAQNQLRLDNARDKRDQYAVLGRDLIALDTATAHASGGFTETEGGYDVYLHSAGGTVDLGDEDYIIMRNAARRRGEIRYGMELADMDRRIAELEAAMVTAHAQLELAETRVQVAKQGQKIAETKKKHAEANLEYAENKEFTAELWFNLAEAVRDIATTYLERAVEIAALMEDAYNFEFDQELKVIKDDYASRDELAGLLAGDLLKVDIDYFSFHRITQVKVKSVPAKIYWSLAQRSPFLLYDFRRTGRAQFEISLQDLDEMYPGTYLHKLKAVSLVVEGLIGADGIYGTVSNAGISFYKTRDGSSAVRVQGKETMLLSAYDLQRDSVVFPPSQEVRGVFEDTGLATSWTIDIPLGLNDLNYQAVRDLRLVFYFESFHDPLLEAAVTAALPATGSWTRTYSARDEFPDAFFRFQDSGELAFDIRSGDFPHNHAAVTMEALKIVALPHATYGHAVMLRLEKTGGPAPDPFTTDDTTGVFSSDPTDAGNPLNAFTGASPIGDWVLSADFEANPSFVNTDPEGIRPPRFEGLLDLVISVEYAYQRRSS